MALTAGCCSAGGLGSLRSYTYDNTRYHNLRDVASYYGMTMRVPPGKHIYLQSKWSELRFEVDSRQAELNDVVLWLHVPIRRRRGKWLISTTDATKTIDPLLRPSEATGVAKPKVVVLDPGHGGNDKGAVGRRNVEEKRVVLDVAKRARGHLANAGFKVYLTRETDRYISLNERTAKARKWGADAFVSIHLNAAASRSASGLETYVVAHQGFPPTARSTLSKSDRYAFPGNRHDEANVVLGHSLQKGLLEKVKGKDRGLRHARFVVLKNAPCPAALIECGFLSNQAEENKMLRREHREAIALAIAQGIIEYSKAVDPPKKGK